MVWSDKKVGVIGGGGFLGREIIRQLLELGCRGISSFGRSEQPELEQAGISVTCGDIRSKSDVNEFVRGNDIIFLTAAKAGIWGRKSDFYSINYDGALNVRDACLENGVNILVYTSSPSVAYSALENVENMSETGTYPEKYLGYYPASKSLAEQALLRSVSDTLRITALRPHLIWGKGDPHLVPKIIEAAKSGRLKIVGDGKSIVDMTHVKNAAGAHICAAERLHSEDGYKKVSGRAYFISDNSPVKLWDWINSLLNSCGIPELTETVSFRKAYYIGAVLEGIYRVLNIKSDPPMTRFAAGQLSHSHYFNISAAENDLGYRPTADTEKELELLIDSIKQGIPGRTG